MGIDPAAILAEISDLVQRLARAEAENAQLRQALADAQPAEPPTGI